MSKKKTTYCMVWFFFFFILDYTVILVPVRKVTEPECLCGFFNGYIQLQQTLANGTDTIFVSKQTIVCIGSLSLASTCVHPGQLCFLSLHRFAFSPLLKEEKNNKTPDILVSLYKYYCNCVGRSENCFLG